MGLTYNIGHQEVYVTLPTWSICYLLRQLFRRLVTKKSKVNPYRFIHKINITDTLITEFCAVEDGFIIIRQTHHEGNTLRQTRVKLPGDIVKKLEEYYEKFKPT